MSTEHTVKAFDEDITRLRGLIAEMGGLAELAIQESLHALVKGDDKLAKEGPIQGQNTRGKAWDNVTGGFVGITDKYWAAAAIPDQSRAYQGSFTERDQGATKVYQANVRGGAETVAPGASADITQRLFAGAKEVRVVDGYKDSLGIKNFDLLIDWGMFYFFTKPLFYLLDWFYRLVGNFGVAILLVTVVVKAVFFPLANKSYKSMSAMKKVQPQMAELLGMVSSGTLTPLVGGTYALADARQAHEDLRSRGTVGKLVLET